MTTPQQRRATQDTWMFPPADGWTFDQVKDSDLPFDWDLVDGLIGVRGRTKLWHNHVRDGLRGALNDARTEPYEVVSPCSRQEDRVRKPALLATHKVPYYWRVELDRDRKLAVHEYWLNADTLTYFPAPSHPVHHHKLVTELPFPIEIDLDALLDF